MSQRGRKRKQWQECETVVLDGTLHERAKKWLASKRYIHSPLSTSSFQRVGSRLSRLGRRRVPVDALGNCQFDSIIYSADAPMSAMELVQYLRPLARFFQDRMEGQFKREIRSVLLTCWDAQFHWWPTQFLTTPQSLPESLDCQVSSPSPCGGLRWSLQPSWTSILTWRSPTPEAPLAEKNRLFAARGFGFAACWYTDIWIQLNPDLGASQVPPQFIPQ